VLNERDARAIIKNKEEESEVRDETRARYLEQGAFYPFTFPVTSGPGTLVALLTLTARISIAIFREMFWPMSAYFLLWSFSVFLSISVTRMLQGLPRSFLRLLRMASCGWLPSFCSALGYKSHGTDSQSW